VASHYLIIDIVFETSIQLENVDQD